MMQKYLLSTLNRCFSFKQQSHPCIYLHQQQSRQHFSDKGSDSKKPSDVQHTAVDNENEKEATDIDKEYQALREKYSKKKALEDNVDHPANLTEDQPGIERAIKGLKAEMKKTWHRIQDPFGQYQQSSIFPANVDILIIGGGAIGSSIAYFLKQRVYSGCRVAVLDRDFTLNNDLEEYARASTTLSAGGIQQQFSLHENVEMSAFGAEFLRNIQHHCHIHGEAEAGVNFMPNGYLLCASDEEAETLEQNYQMQKDLGVKSVLLTPNQLQTRFPWLNTDGIALASLGLEKEGWFDPWLYLKAVREKALSLGAEYVQGEAVKFERRINSCVRMDGYDDGTYQTVNEVLVKDKNGIIRSIKFAFCVIAAGADSGQLAQLLKIGDKSQEQGFLFVPVPIEPRKRFVYCFESPNGPGVNTPMVVDTSNTYFRREGLGNYYICGKSPQPNEEPSIDNLEVDYEYFNQCIRPHLAHRVKAFEDLKVSNAWASIQDYNYFDENCIIGIHPAYHNIHFAKGITGHGIQHAPAIGRAMMELLIDGEFKTINLSRFAVSRIIQREEVLREVCVV